MFQTRITPKEIESLPQVSFPGEIVVIDQFGDAFEDAIHYLAGQSVIGFDTESRPSFSANQPSFGTSLLQLSGPDRAFLFRVKHIGMPQELREILSRADILKIGAAISDDNKGLQRYASYTPNAFVDLQRIVAEWGIFDKSVKKMAAIILGVKISKSQQLSNWEAEYLTPAQQHYAATDAWICREMYVRLLGSEKHPLTPEQISEFSGIPLDTLLGHKEKKKTSSPSTPAPTSARRRRRRRKKKTSPHDQDHPQKG